MTVIDKKVNVFSILKTNVLDDDTEMNELLKEVFEMNGLPNVAFYTDSDVFVNDLSENIHLCIVDQVIKGSRLQGIEVVRIIKGRFPKCQIVFVSGTDDPNVLKELLKLRPEGYVDKDQPEFIRCLVEVVEGRLIEIRKNLELAIGLEIYQKKYE